MKTYIRTWNKSQPTQLLVLQFRLEGIGCAMHTNRLQCFDVRGCILTQVWVSSKCNRPRDFTSSTPSDLSLIEAKSDGCKMTCMIEIHSAIQISHGQISSSVMTGGVSSLDRCIKDLMTQKLHHCSGLMCWLMRNLCWSLKLSKFLATNRDLERQSERKRFILLFR